MSCTTADDQKKLEKLRLSGGYVVDNVGLLRWRKEPKGQNQYARTSYCI